MAATLDTSSPRPHGLGIAIVFDWALAAQLLTQAAATPSGRLGQSGGGAGVVAGRVAGAAILAVVGELLRRGYPALRVPQAVLTAAVTAGGVAMVIRLLLHPSDHGLIFSALIQVTFAPFIAIRLLSVETARWFEHARGHGCAPRLCGPAWVSVLVVWSVVWGVVVAWSQSLS